MPISANHWRLRVVVIVSMAAIAPPLDDTAATAHTTRKPPAIGSAALTLPGMPNLDERGSLLAIRQRPAKSRLLAVDAV
jgi:hypothetical protein